MKLSNHSKTFLSLLISLSLISCSVPQTNTNSPSPSISINISNNQDEQKPSFLFVQESQSGSLVKNDNSEDIYTLTLENVSPSTNYFTDRPFRLTGDMKTSDLIEHWNGEGKNSFANEPPNAALSIIDDNGDSRVIVIELTNPSYDKASKKLSYNATILNDYENSNFKSLISNHMFNDELPAKFNSSTLFIDNLTEKLQNISNSKVNPIGNILAKIKTKIETVITSKIKDSIEKIKSNTNDLNEAQKAKDKKKALVISASIIGGLGTLITAIGIIIGIAGTILTASAFLAPLGVILGVIGAVVGLEGLVFGAISGALGLAQAVDDMKNSPDPEIKKQGLALEQHLNTLKSKQAPFSDKMNQLKIKQTELQNK